MTLAGRGGAVWRLVLPPYIAAKGLSLLVPILTVWSHSLTPSFPTRDELAGGFLQWDARSYVDIATAGYPTHLDYHDAFLPGYPVLIRMVALVVRDQLVAAIIVSAVAELVALYLVALLVLGERDADAARFSTWTFAFWPFAFFLTAPYTESTFIAAAAGSLVYARRGDVRTASLLGFAATLVRVTGVALVPALVVEVLRRPGRRRIPELLMVALVVLPLGLYALYMRAHTGDALAFLHAQSLPSFSHSAAWPWSGARATWDIVFSDNNSGNTYAFAIEMLFGIAGAVVCVIAWVHRRFPVSLAAYCTAIWLLATSISFWRSVPRYELAMFPALILLADATRARSEWRAGIVAVSAGLMAYGASVFASGRWLG